jgi:hypothetical protein
VTECTGGNLDRASDPWTAFAVDGTALFESLVLDPAQPQTPFGARKSGILVPVDRSWRNLGFTRCVAQQ